MFDLTSPATYKNVATWYKDVTSICPEIPFALVGNKIDVHEHIIPLRRITFHKKNNIKMNLM